MPYVLEEKPDLEYLAHFGVKGMKWGVRKARDKVGRSAKRFGNYLIGNGKAATADRERFKRMRDDNKVYKSFRQRRSAEYGSQHGAVRLAATFCAGFASMTILQLTSGERFTPQQIARNSAIAGAGLFAANETVASYDRWKYEREKKRVDKLLKDIRRT